MPEDDQYRVRSIHPPRLDRDDPFPATDCQHEDISHLFFGPDTDDGEPPFVRRQREDDARAICATCPHLIECGLHALEHEEYGIWGGLTEQERRSLGGRGRCWGAGRGPGLKETVRRMGRAGIKQDDIEALLRRWSRRRKALGEEEVA